MSQSLAFQGILPMRHHVNQPIIFQSAIILEVALPLDNPG